MCPFETSWLCITACISGVLPVEHSRCTMCDNLKLTASIVTVVKSTTVIYKQPMCSNDSKGRNPAVMCSYAKQLLTAAKLKGTVNHLGSILMILHFTKMQK